VSVENLFLKALREDDRARLLPLLFHRNFLANEVLVEPGGRLDVVAFPREVQFSQTFGVALDEPVETALIGREGLTGPVLVLSETCSPWRISARFAGAAWCAKTDALRGLAADAPDLRRRLLGLATYYGAQNSLSSACAANHPIAGRVASWLLNATDLSGSPELFITQEDIGIRLSIQRTSVTEAFKRFKYIGATQTRRGRILISNRRALASVACPCHPGLGHLARSLGVPYPDTETAVA
jgi:hypothetical protein